MLSFGAVGVIAGPVAMALLVEAFELVAEHRASAAAADQQATDAEGDAAPASG